MKIKKIKTKLCISLSVLIISFFVSASTLNTPSTEALVEEKHNQYNTNSINRLTWKWNSTEVISTESTDSSLNPSLAFDSTGIIHIAWNDFSLYAGADPGSDIFYKRWNSSSSSWTNTELVSTESTFDSFRPSLAVDSTGTVHVAWDDNTDYAGAGWDEDIFYKRWDSSTSSWTMTEVISTESTSASYSPSLVVDSTGNAHIAWDDNTDYAGAGTDVDIFYKHWDSSNSSWTSVKVVSIESTEASYYPSVATDAGGNIHIAWEDETDYAGEGTDRDIFYKRWDASSSSWITTEVFSTESTADSFYPSLAVDSAGNIHAAWSDYTNYTGAGTDRDIFYKRWDASSSSWTTTEVVSTESTADSWFPSLGVDVAGNVHIVWDEYTDYAGSGTDEDIFYKRWDSSTSSWTMTEVVSTESTSDSKLPSLGVDVAGNVHIVWYDYTDYDGSGTDEDIFYKFLENLPVVPELTSIVSNPTKFVFFSSMILGTFVFMFVVTRIRKKNSKPN